MEKWMGDPLTDPTLICLVSGQRMQNIIPLFQRGMEYKQVIMVVSAERGGGMNAKFAEIAADIGHAFSDRCTWKLHPAAVDPIAPESTRQACLDILSLVKDLKTAAINFTGGTKPMSIGAYLAGQQMGVPMMYVDTELEQIILHHNDQVDIQPFNLDVIPVVQSLAAHGYPIDAGETAKKQLTPPQNELAQFTLKHRPQVFSSWIVLRNLLVGNDPRNRVLDKESARVILHHEVIFSVLESHNLIYAQNGGYHFSEEAHKLVDGGWLEGYAYVALKEAGTFMDVQGPLVVRKQDRQGEIKNELDLVCSVNGKLAIIECKSGKMIKTQASDPPAGKKKKRVSQAAAFLNRLRTLQQSMTGTFGRSILVTVESAIGNASLARAADYTSRIIGLEDLARLEELIYTDLAMKGR